MEQQGIAEFMVAIPVPVEIFVDQMKYSILGKGAQELEMTFARLMDARQDCIDDAQICSFTDPSARNAVS